MPDDSTTEILDLDHLDPSTFPSGETWDDTPIMLEDLVAREIDAAWDKWAEGWVVDGEADEGSFVEWTAPLVAASVRTEAANGRHWTDADDLIDTINSCCLVKLSANFIGDQRHLPMRVPPWEPLTDGPHADPDAIDELLFHARTEDDAANLLLYINNLQNEVLSLRASAAE